LLLGELLLARGHLARREPGHQPVRVRPHQVADLGLGAEPGQVLRALQAPEAGPPLAGRVAVEGGDEVDEDLSRGALLRCRRVSPPDTSAVLAAAGARRVCPSGRRTAARDLLGVRTQKRARPTPVALVDDPGMTDRTATDVTVLGLGAMGSALARALVGAGHRTVVWNRTASRAEPLVALGAEAAPDPAAAVAGADVVIVSLVDGEAATAVLTAAGPALAGTTVVELPPSRPGRPRPSASSSRAPAPPTSRAR